MLRKDLYRASPIAGTADRDEIARFETLADEWWNPDGAFKVVHGFNRARVALLAEHLPRLLWRDPAATLPLSGLKVVDVGCGAGLVSEPLSRLGAEVLGIDAAERNVMVAERHARGSGAPVSYRHALPEQLADRTGDFDAVLALEVVEHVADLDSFLKAATRLVAPGGVLVVGTLNRTLRSFLKAIIGAEYLLRWLPRGTHDWRRFVTPQELGSILKGQGLSVVERCGISLRPLSMQWSVGSDLSVAYLQFHRRA